MTTIRQRLLDYTEAPPRTAWEGIAAALNETPAYAQKLQQYEQLPPAHTWEKIAGQLPTPQVSLSHRRSKLFQYAIAAAVLGFVATGTVVYLKNQNGVQPAMQPQNAVTINANQTPSATQAPQKTGVTAAETNIKTDSDVSDGIATVSDDALVRFSPRVRIAKTHSVTGTGKIMPKMAAMIDTELADRYMIATTADGNVVRLPKKAYSDYACAAAMNDYRCKQRIVAIQSKMAASVATDFTEFMDLLKTLQEPQ